MNMSNPCSVAGGGDISRVTSCEFNIASSEGASDGRSSRSVTLADDSTGRRCCQPVVNSSRLCVATALCDRRAWILTMPVPTDEQPSGQLTGLLTKSDKFNKTGELRTTAIRSRRLGKASLCRNDTDANGNLHNCRGRAPRRGHFALLNVCPSLH